MFMSSSVLSVCFINYAKWEVLIVLTMSNCILALKINQRSGCPYLTCNLTWITLHIHGMSYGKVHCAECAPSIYLLGTGEKCRLFC